MKIIVFLTLFVLISSAFLVLVDLRFWSDVKRRINFGGLMNMLHWPKVIKIHVIDDQHWWNQRNMWAKLSKLTLLIKMLFYESWFSSCWINFPLNWYNDTSEQFWTTLHVYKLYTSQKFTIYQLLPVYSLHSNFL